MKRESKMACYRQMRRIRMTEERIAALYPEGEMRCPVHLCTGQEAVAVGVCEALEKNDYVLSNHRSHGHYLAKGGNLRAMIAELYGKETGCTAGKGGSMHLIDLEVGFLGAAPIVSSTIPVAVGVAMGSAMKKENRVAVAFFGEAATEEGVFHESINFAMLKKLPIVFVCENNLYSVCSPLSVRQPKERHVFEVARGHGLASYQGDGNDVEEVYRLAEHAIKRARLQQGPTFLEFMTYRWLEHCGPNFDQHLGYRSEEEFLIWQGKCPIKRFAKKLKGQNILNEKNFEAIGAELRGEIEDAVTFAKMSSFPSKERLLDHIYAEKSGAGPP